MNYAIIMRNFHRGLWGEKQVLLAVRKGIITDEQAASILSSRFGASVFVQGASWEPGIRYLAGDRVSGYTAARNSLGREPSANPEYWEAVE